MAKHFVTTMNKNLFDDYCKDLLMSYKNTTQKYPKYVYEEDDIAKYRNMSKFIEIIYINIYVYIYIFI